MGLLQELFGKQTPESIGKKIVKKNKRIEELRHLIILDSKVPRKGARSSKEINREIRKLERKINHLERKKEKLERKQHK